MRADRLVSILLLLQVNRRTTARELAKRLEVSERTIHRDMDALCSAGVPVLAERGNGGGWGLMEAYKTNLTGLNHSEILSLFLTKPPQLLSDLGLHQASEGALIKLLAALPSMSRRDAEYARQRIHIDTAGWRNSPENVASLPVLQEAIWQERQLQFLYERAGCEPSERLADPLGLVAKGSVWYLVAAVDGAPRTYRVSRISEARVTDQPCARPANFDLAAYWQQSAAEFQAGLPRFYAKIRIGPDVPRWMSYRARASRVEHSEPPDAHGWTTLTIRFDVEEEACQFALSFGGQAEVLEPESLRQNVIASAQAMLALYVNGRQ
ncbi:MAG TPA: YafY family protein [Bryobacteraceae bacterium]|jgi:predicted DNA-binding transcriptional regulator YafY|nr:YafY family protein [Bryobacteraceae bacterium]